MHRAYLAMVTALLVFAGCLGGGGEKKAPDKPAPAEAEGVVSFDLSPSEVTLMVGGEVTHEFILRLREPAPEYVVVRQEDEKAEVKVRVVPEKIQKADGDFRGKLIFAEPPSYLLGDQRAGLVITDTEGSSLGKVNVDVYVLPPGAS